MITGDFDRYGHNWRTFFKKNCLGRKIMRCHENGEIIVEVGGNMWLNIQDISVIRSKL